MKQKIKYILLFIVMAVYMLNVGCSLPSSSEMKANNNKTVIISGDLISPNVKIPGFLPSVYESIASNSICYVNDQIVSCKIATDSTFTIANAPFSDAYRIRLTSGQLNLYAFVAGDDKSYLVAPMGLSNLSTADYFLIQAYAQDMGVPMSELTPYTLDTSLTNELAAVLNANLSNASGSLAILNTALANKRAEILKRKSFFKALTVSKPASYFDDSWKGDVKYYILDSRGKRSISVSATAKFNISVNGDHLFGNAEITPDLSTFQSDLTFYFEGIMKDGVVTFRRRGTGGTVKEPLLEQWTLFPTTKGLAVKSENIDFFLNRGIELDPAKSVLKIDHFSTW